MTRSPLVRFWNTQHLASRLRQLTNGIFHEINQLFLGYPHDYGNPHWNWMNEEWLQECLQRLIPIYSHSINTTYYNQYGFVWNRIPPIVYHHCPHFAIWGYTILPNNHQSQSIVNLPMKYLHYIIYYHHIPVAYTHHITQLTIIYNLNKAVTNAASSSPWGPWGLHSDEALALAVWKVEKSATCGRNFHEMKLFTPLEWWRGEVSRLVATKWLCRRMFLTWQFEC